MELFDEKFVHFMWDDELEGKACFVSDDIDTLREEVTKGISRDIVHEHRTNIPTSYPFETIADYYRFAYYDPNYEVKKAYTEGKKIQYKFPRGERWHDMSESAIKDIASGGLRWFDGDCDYRIESELNAFCKYCKGKGVNCYNCTNKDTEGSYLKLFPEKYIKPEESKRMTYRQLAEWLAKGMGQFTHTLASTVFVGLVYDSACDNEEVPTMYKIRRWGSDEWIEPTLAIYKEVKL